MRLVSILTYIVLALATTTTVNANLKDLVNKVKDTIKTDVAKIIVQPKTKIIALDSNIVPTWNDVVPKCKHKPIKKITLKTVLNRWNKMEKKSRDAYAALVSSPMDKIQAIAKVTKFYDGSEKCLKQQGKLTRKVNQKTFNTMMKAVRKCIDQTNAPPTFEVDVNATVPVVVEDDDDEESELDTGGSNTTDSTGGDDDDTSMNNSGSGSDSSDSGSGSGSDATPTMVPTLTPTAAPTQESTKAPTEAPTEAQKGDVDSLTDVFHSSAEDSKADVTDNSEPDVVHESNNAESSTDPYESNPDTVESTLDHPLSDDSDKSISNTSIEETSIKHTIVNDEVQLQPTSADDQVTNIPYVYKPSLAQVAPFSALDVNGDGQMTPDEWTIYVTGLHDAAYSRVEKGKDDRAKRMIMNVIEFHYSILGGCINNNVGTQSLKDDATFQAMVKTIENNCYVKFRYSLLAGPPPFEWVAKRNATVTPSQIEEWFNKVVNKAKADIKNKRIITLTRAEQEQVEHVMDCIYKVLGTCTASALNRDLYYTELDQVGNCVASFTN